MSEKYNSEFRQRLTLLVIDKVIIGIFLLLFGFFIQWALEQQRAALAQQQAERDRLTVDQQRIRDVTLAASQVLTEIVASYRKTVSTAVRDLLAVLNEYESHGQVREPNDRDTVRNIVENIENAMGQLATANQNLPNVADPFVRLIRRIRSDLVNKQRDREAFRADVRNLMAIYAELLNELRITSVKAMEADRRAVSKILASGSP